MTANNGPPRVEYDHLGEIGSDVHEIEKAILYKTVDVFSVILNRKLVLKNAAVPGTDGVEIRVPLDDLDSYRLLEHQIAYVLFESDRRAKRFFLENYWKGLQKTQVFYGQEIDEEFIKSISDIVDILDNYRVKDLWSYIYAGSYQEIAAREQKVFLTKLPSKADTLVDAFLRFSACGVAVSGKWEAYQDLLSTALGRVAGGTYTGVLATAKWLIIQLVDWQLKQEHSRDVDQQTKPGAENQKNKSVEMRWKALTKVAEILGTLPTSLDGVLVGTEESAILGSTREQDSKNSAMEALRTDPVDSNFKDKQKEKMQRLVQQTSVGLGTVSDNQGLHQGVHAKVIFHEIHPPEPGVLPSPLDPEDEYAVLELQQIFRLVHSRRRNTLQESGTDIDVDAYIERRLSGIPLSVFRQEERGQGFHAVLLLDKSVSMGVYENKGGNRVLSPKTALARAYRASRIITKALDFPFVRLDVWGFASRSDGCVEIVRYDPARNAFDTSLTDFSGATPLHVAIRVGALHLAQSTDKKQLFVITDGLPTFVRRDGPRISQKYLMEATGREVSDARELGVNVTGVILDGVDTTPITDDQAIRMFGLRDFWRRIESSTFGQDLVALVSSSFTDFLRSR